MYIIHIASEMAPVAKVGGLGDVVLGLCRELTWKGHDLDIIIPKYDCIDTAQIRDLTIDTPDLLSFYAGEWFHNTVWVGWVENLKVYFIEPHHPRHFFDRGCFYGCEDDAERYLYFCRAALEFLYKKSLQPEIIHLHDWQTAAMAVLYRDMYNALGYTKPKVMYTIHNIEYQGKCGAEDLTHIGLKGETYLTPEKLQDTAHPKSINLMKGGIVYSDAITTVSPNYAKEVLTPSGGKGLDAILKQHLAKFTGVLNGVDYSYWNPEIDRFLPTHFSARTVPDNKHDHNTLDRKGFLKMTLRQRVSLAEEYKPIVGCVTRLVPQKGIKLIQFALEYTLQKGGQFVLLGSSPIPEITKEFLTLKNRYATEANVAMILHHEEDLAHLIFAGCDMLIVPSIFEPCGLTQLIALKYGTVPIVRKTGGLADTIFDVDLSGKPFPETNGYSFDLPEPKAFKGALERAFECWFHDPERWRQLMLQGMHFDYSWNKPSDVYLQIYKQLMGKP